MPSITVFNQGCSDSMMVTYPTNGMNPMTDPIMSLRDR